MTTTTKQFNTYNLANSVDPVNDLLLIYNGSSATLQNISRNTYLALSSAPLGLTDTQSPTNKTFNNTNTITVKDESFTLQNSSSVTKQAVFSASSITAGQTRTITIPDASGTLALLGSSNTFTGTNSFTGSSWSGGTISNTSISSDNISGFSVSNSGTIYGIGVTTGVISTANSVNGAALTNTSVTASKLATGATSATVATLETTTSTSYVDLTTTTDTVTVTIGANGLVLLILTCDHYNSTSGSFDYTSFAMSGANTLAASDANALGQKNAQASDEKTGSWVKVLTGLVAGSTTFKMKYRVTANTGNFQNRSISVVPL